MKIKTKAAAGISILVLILVSLGVVSTYFIHKLSHASGQILQDNYASVEYCSDMQLSLEQLHQSHVLWMLQQSDTQPEPVAPDYTSNLQTLNEKLQAEKQNITETGEQEATDALAKSLKRY